MPNWCENIVSIKLRSKRYKKSLNKFVKDNYTKKGIITLDFNKIIPQPKFENENDWYNWNCKNWGTKWNIDEIDVITDNIEMGFAKIIFWTAWSPPIPIIEELSNKYKGIEFKIKYCDPAMAMRGTYKAYKRGDKLE
jgi:hypothetical protein